MVKRMNKVQLRWCVLGLVFIAFTGDAMANNDLNKQRHEEVEQHEFTKSKRFDFDGEQYWYYKMLNKVSHESVNNDMLFGEIIERDSKIYFQI